MKDWWRSGYGAEEYWGYAKGEGLNTRGWTKREACNYVFRIRREGEDDKKAYYGVIKGGFGVGAEGVLFNYCINPEPGERNIEQIQGGAGRQNLWITLQEQQLPDYALADWRKKYGRVGY